VVEDRAPTRQPHGVADIAGATFAGAAAS
jgi:hypothetical protein